MRILDLGSGRDWIHWKDAGQTVDCVDSSYGNQPFIDMEYLNPDDNITLHGENIFTFLENYSGEPYTKIIANRVLEHIAPDQIHYLIYLLHKVGRRSSRLEIVVPDFTKVAESISTLDIQMTAKDFNLGMVRAHTEIFNTEDDPHRSIWNESLSHYYIELENYWKIEDMGHVTMEKRDWYLNIICTHTGD